MNGWRCLATLCGVASLGMLPTSEAIAESRDPALRGLDAFFQMPHRMPAGTNLPLQIQVVGFSSVTSMEPLGGATIEAAWDPKSLGPNQTVAPPAVHATADATGKAHLEILVPPGSARDLSLLLSMRSGAHARTRSFTLQRTSALEVSLYVSDKHVVPGGAVSAWAIVRSAATRQPLAGTGLMFELLEGGMPYFVTRAVTDAGGSAMARVPIPLTDDAGIAWVLRATSSAPGNDVQSAEVPLLPRDETPGTPNLVVTWDSDRILAGDRATLHALVRDASDNPVVDLPIRYWVGPDGMRPPASGEEWDRSSVLSRTDASGSVVAHIDTPGTVTKLGIKMNAVVRAKVAGHDIEETTELLVGPLAPSLSIVPERGGVVPGVEQRLVLQALDARKKPLRAAFQIRGDGLDARVDTDDRGHGEFEWRAPVDLGARREQGPCAGGVAAALLVRPLDALPDLVRHPEPFELCIRIDRQMRALVVPEHPFGRAAEWLHFDLPGGAGRPWTVVMQPNVGGRAVSGWIDDGALGIDLRFPTGSNGVWTVSAFSPGQTVQAASAAVLVLPETLPKLVARWRGGRAVPGGTLVIDADLVDQAGKGRPGTIAVVVLDLHGGADPRALADLDTRTALASTLSDEPSNPLVAPDAMLDGDRSYDALRRAALATRAAAPHEVENDPARDARKNMENTFGDVVRSLEGAVYESSMSPEALRDVRRRSARGFAFNPELMTLATAARNQPPETPGGEPLSLSDLVTMDPQISFDRVARRVTRLKLFRILAAIRQFSLDHQLDRDEPIFRDPNALLRRLLLDGTLAQGSLLDPWGHTIQFLRSTRPAIPFVHVRGHELRAPGPDGILGNADDVHDPFERVLKSGTPYAGAVDEDRIVDARWDMEVGDSTVGSWEALLEKLTGTSLGDGWAVETGHGSLGGSSGYGSGGVQHHETVARGSRSIDMGVAWWSPPARTDSRGHLELRVPLGDIETTWRITIVGIPDQAGPAVANLDIPAELPLSVRVDSGARWTEGDEVDVALVARNRTEHPVRATLVPTPRGVAEIVGPTHTIVLDVPARGAATAAVRLRASRAGEAALDVMASAAGMADDTVHHSWEVRPDGELLHAWRSVWVEGERDLDVPSDPGHLSPAGPPWLVLERGVESTLGAALGSLEPDKQTSRLALVDALEVASGIERWALALRGQNDPLFLRAKTLHQRASGRILALTANASCSDALGWPGAARAQVYLPECQRPPLECPPNTGLTDDERLAALEAEPLTGTATTDCWEAFVGSTLQSLSASADPVRLARAVLALAERPQRAVEAASLTNRLHELVPLRSGSLVLAPAIASDRARVATILAALLRSAKIGADNSFAVPRLASWILVQRDAGGGFGSSLATRSVVRALVFWPFMTPAPVHATIEGGVQRRQIDLSSEGNTTVPLNSDTIRVHIQTRGAGVLARMVRPMLRSWKNPPDAASSPIHLETKWPLAPARDRPAALKVSVRHDLGRGAVIRARIPLPPGAGMAEPVNGMRQLHGALLVTVTLAASPLPAVVDVPIRFTLSGKFTVPEAVAHLANDEAPLAYAPARPIVVR